MLEEVKLSGILLLLEIELNRARLFHSYVSLAIFDTDDFGCYNNTHGHPQGDVLLKEMCEIIKKNLGPIDNAGRYGGEEFIVVMPGLKPAEAKMKMEEVRKKIEDHYFQGEETQPGGRVTVSVGLATALDPSVTKEELIKQADKALYKSKANGKNKTTAVSIVDRYMDPVTSD